MKKFLILLAVVTTTAHALKVTDSKVILESLDDYSVCQTRDYTGGWCHEALLDWVKSHPKDAFKAGKLTRLNMNHHASIPFFEKALSDKKFDCKDEDVKLGLISALNLPETGYEKTVDPAMKVFKKCAKDLKESLVAEATLDSLLFKRTCDKLEISGLKKKKCEELKK